MLDTEKKYIEQLKSGLDSYGKIFAKNDLPSPLKGKKDILFSCLERVLTYHDIAFYPILEKHSDNMEHLMWAVSEQITVS